MKKLNIGVLFGGRSGEHEVSLVSASSIIKTLDKSKYEVIPIGIAKDGRWYSGSDIIETLKNGGIPQAEQEISISFNPRRKGLFKVPSSPALSPRQTAGGQAEGRGGCDGFIPLDVVFPVLHGPYGEDGTVQGLLELAGIPYVGAGVLGSAVGMDKIVQKDIARQAGINVTPSVWFLAGDYKKDAEKIIKDIEEKFSYPLFVKPSNSGSSVGISKAHDRKELKSAIEEAVRYDRRILVEKGIEEAREIEVSVLGNDDPVASCPGEIISSNEFYDYDAKYVDGKSRDVIPADLPKGMVEGIREAAVKVYLAVDCAGMARVDFLVAKDEIYFSELNTIPGFTSISMYPKLLAASGISYPGLLDRLISLAIERFEERSKFLTSYKPKQDWYR